MLVMVLVGTFYTTYEKRGGGLLGFVPQKLKTKVKIKTVAYKFW